MKNTFLKFLHFNRPERMGAAALIIISMIALCMPVLYRWYSPKSMTDFSDFEADIEKLRNAMPAMDNDSRAKTDAVAGESFYFNPNTASLEDFIRLGLSEKTAQSICNYRAKGGQFRQPADFKKIYTLSESDYERLLPYIQLQAASPKFVEYSQTSTSSGFTHLKPFAFDPNTATETELLQLGLTNWITDRILKYRNKGGKFRNKEDLGKIYGFPESDYDRLEPYISIAATGQSTPLPTNVTAINSPVHKVTPRTGMAPASLDINRAAVEHWQMLPGIGEKRAQMIINFREKLGGFLSVEQVAETRGLPDSVYQVIRPMLAQPSNLPHTLNINAATTEQLDAHPYISFKQASLIVAHRSQHGNYQKIEDLLHIPAFIDKAWLDRVKPYLSIQ